VTRPDPVEIAAHTEGDGQQLFGLARSVFGGRPELSDDRVLSALAADVVFVARDAGQPAGYVALRPERGPATVVEQLFVAPGHERGGIGRRLLAYAEGYAIAEQMQALRVVVEHDNDAARSFYRRLGFVPIETEVFELVLPRSDR
jgi:ribosomal protein S18 acetylase RimI-like enzyme